MNTLIEKAISIAGSQKKLADACSVSQPAVYKWLHGGSITPKKAIAVEVATGGEVSRGDLCPDVFGAQVT